MAESEQAQQQDVTVLFKQWRAGDPDAGVTMAQRFTDWYYTIAVMWLGESNARPALEAACQIFAQRIMDVENQEELLDFAHNIIFEQLNQAGGRAPGSDVPSPLTNNRTPSSLIVEASSQLSAEQIRILHQTYTGQGDPLQIDPQMPVAALEARQALKSRLQASGISFGTMNSLNEPDQAPLPLYEAHRLRTDDENWLFEQWLLSDIDLCKELTEFAPFSSALRAGALANARSSVPETAPSKPVTTTTKPPLAKVPELTPAPPASNNMLPMVVVGLLVLAAILWVVTTFLL